MAERCWAAEDSSMGDLMLAEIRRQLPVVDRTLSRFGTDCIADYFREIAFSGAQPLQSPDDLLEMVADMVAPVLGAEIARDVAAELRDYPVILTANHHGVEYFAQSFQGNLLFYLYRLQNTEQVRTVPIFACGGVPLSNSSYPKGMLIYNAIQPDTGEIPFKLPVFPNNFNQTQVLAAPPFDEGMVQTALRRLEKSIASGVIPEKAGETAWNLLHEEYLKAEVLEQPGYSCQVMVLNNRISKKIFRDPSGLPEVVYIEFEALASLLIQKDLSDVDSLIYRVCFDERLCPKVIANLDGRKGCWNLQRLKGLLEGAVKESPHVAAHSGTVFFWGLDMQGRRFPLALTDFGSRSRWLAGRDGLGEWHRIPWTPAGISEALAARRIYPGLFTMFTAVSLARGLECVGGYFQGDYLYAMQQGLIQGLLATDDPEYAEAVAGIATRSYLSGMMVLLAGSVEHRAIPAGPLEIIERGGIEMALLRQLSSISVDTAHRLGLFNIYPDVVSRYNRMDQWQPKIGAELATGNAITLLNCR